MTDSIRRRILPVLQQHLNAPEITLLIGPSQVGKTTLIRTLLRGLEAKGGSAQFGIEQMGNTDRTKRLWLCVS
jgi:ABC-type multidrug transport system ATPase subunit